ncbi:hypothetical protein QT969_05255 [Rhodococcus sp. CSLK01-03]|uniref:Aromatic ring-opening dioxygenase, LigB subunit n=1 Tax=Rhodococcus indonesiensis TaxID=3055869 RepID=A0ABT7RJ77_9NOCA|nr:hypothetical protein [Rhodococcus indonesiensis]MDM7487684.1 hypothetical protein [Rhodococcus indonesiensis]
MLIAAAFVPSPPLLVPELTGSAATETADLRAAVLAVGSKLRAAARWVVVGAGTDASDVPDTAVGTFRGFGVDLVVALGPAATGTPDPQLPLPALIAGWLRDRTAPVVRATTHVVPAGTSPQDCARLGRQLRSTLDADRTPTALLVVADGPATLTAKAPGAYHPEAQNLDEALGVALAVGDVAALAALDPALCAETVCDGRAAWQVLAAVFGPDGPASAATTHSSAPYGVGYHVGMWRP